MSRCLTETSIDHIVLERGRLAERWRSERWDSLRLLSPNWASRLPGWSYRGDDPAGYMTAPELVAHFERYAQSFDAPIREESAVVAVRRAGDAFAVETADVTWRASHVVIATGWCDRPHIPPAAAGLDPAIAQLTPISYRNPDQLPGGGVLVVGASASGVQIADELVRAGRDVVLAAGRHNRLPRHYRGMDIWWWLDRIGTFGKTIDDTADAKATRHEGSLQLIGRPDHRDVDLATLSDLGVRVAGRLLRIDATRVDFASDLGATTAAADERMRRVLGDIDRHIAMEGLEAEVTPPTRPQPLSDTRGIGRVELRRAGIASVVWATGFTRRYPWLQVPVLDETGEIRHARGVTPVDGLYVLGQRFQHRRDSNFIDGVRHDATYVAHHIATCQRHADCVAS